MPQPVAISAALSGVQRIEASAGTGKTWTLSGLLLRLVVEKGLPIDRILAVTFTKAATAELRERVRLRLQAMLELLQGQEIDDVVCQSVDKSCPDKPQAIKRTLAALRGFDDAPIFTIHGFCQRALGDRALACGLPFELDVVPDSKPILRQVVLDFWRSEIATAAPATGFDPRAHDLFVTWITRSGIQPDDVVGWLAPLLDKTELRIDSPAPPGVVPRAIAEFPALVVQLRTLWIASRPEILRLLTGNDALKGNMYAAASIPNWAEEIDGYLAAGGNTLSLPKCFHKFTTSGITAGTKKDATSPKHAFFVACQALSEANEELVSFFEARWLTMQLQLLRSANAEVRRRTNDLRQQSYHDMLVNLRNALLGEGGDLLAVGLRTRYPAALIDEFQDTDPIQYEIFRRIYMDAPADSIALFLVGDPKQAIYGFRGADIFSYLRAAAAAPDKHTLSENQRSVAPLVRAVNGLFSAQANPFLFQGIEFVEVGASSRPKDALVEFGKVDQAPLRFFLMNPRDDGKPQNKGHADPWSADVTASEIARLLTESAKGKVTLGARPLRSGDIAVLVDSGRHGEMVRTALSAHGIACALRTKESVFGSREAEQLERILLAIAEPHREPVVRAALATELLGETASQLVTYDGDQASWERRLLQFQDHHDVWRQQGFMRMFRRLLVEQGVSERLSGFEDGSRRLTNLFHMAELIHAESVRHPGVEAQIAWLASQRRDPTAAEDNELRLESDENLIQILTVHASKGLEYPVTFVPYLWQGSSWIDGDGPVFYHDPDADNCATLDCGTDRNGTALISAKKEELAERLRLAYVALTRAKNRCYVCWGRIKDAEGSPLAWLLHGAGDDIGVRLPDDELMRQRLEELGEATGGTITISNQSQPDQVVATVTTKDRPLAPRILDRAPPAPFRLTSFSALHDRSGEWRADEPDHDQQAASAPAGEAEERLRPGGTRFSFPRGAAAGQCLHDMLEDIDFSQPSISWDEVILGALKKAGFSSTWLPEVRTWISEVCATRLPGGAVAGEFSLANLPNNATRRELEFHLPFASVDISQIPIIAARHGYRLGPIPAERIAGFLKGFIDLVTLHNGRYYIADYKSNWLGGHRDAYLQPAVANAMRDSGYHLQYLLYTVAVNRWLAARGGDYSYESHFGGIQYLFLRGMRPDWVSDEGVPHGVFWDRPRIELINELDALFSGSLRKAA